jgi:hypothetical protein
MYLLYVDESGDTGHLSSGSPSEIFILSGIVIHELAWKPTLDKVIDFRRYLKNKYNFKMKEEIHCNAFFSRGGGRYTIPKYQRMQIFKEALQFQAGLPDFSVTSVIIDKRNKTPPYDIFENAWTVLLQRFHNTIQFKNFPGPQNTKDLGLVISDATDGEKLTQLLRRLRRFNFVPSQYQTGSRSIPLDLIVEDPVSRDSKHSQFVQLCDVNAYSLLQHCKPNSYFKTKGGRNYFKILAPVTNKKASRTNNMGVVKL